MKLRLSTLKPIHAGWIVDFYNYITSEEGRKVIESGWEAAGIADAIRLGSKVLPSLDPFDDIDPLIDQFDVSTDINAVCNLTEEQIEGNQKDTEEEDNGEDDDEDAWVLPEKQCSAFDIFENFDDEKEL